VLGGHVVASVVRNMVATALVFGVALLIGFRPEATVGEWLGAIALLLLFMVAISWLAAAVGLLANSPEAASGFTFLVMFLPYASSAFVPIDTMPSWLHGFARSQPCTPVIESIRALLASEPTQGQLGPAVMWCSAILIVSILAASALFAHKTR